MDLTAFINLQKKSLRSLPPAVRTGGDLILQSLEEFAAAREQAGTAAPELITPRAAANLVGVCYATVNRWIHGGKLTTYKTPGGFYRIDRNELLRLMKHR